MTTRAIEERVVNKVTEGVAFAMRAYKQTAVATCLGLVLINGCAGDEQDPANPVSLLAGSEDEAPPLIESETAQARRARMNITSVAMDGKAPWTGTARELAIKYVIEDCVRWLRVSPGGAPFSTEECSSSKMIDTTRSATTAPIALPPVDNTGKCNTTTTTSTSSTTWTAGGTKASTTGGKWTGGTGSTSPTSSKSDPCGVAVCRVQTSICAANKLLELANSVGETTVNGTSGSIVIPPQDEASAAMLAQEAFLYASWAVGVAGENLRYAASGASTIVGSCSSQALKNKPAGTQNMTYGAHLSASLVDATMVADEAGRRAIASTVAVADASFSDYRNMTEASIGAWTAPFLSRATAGHIAVGGAVDSGLAGHEEGYCPTAMTPTVAVETATDFIRATGLPLADLGAGLPFTELWEQGVEPEMLGPMIDQHPLRARFAVQMGDPSLATMPANEFLTIQGFTEDDFAQASEYMLQQAKAFALDPNVVLPVSATGQQNGTYGAFDNADSIYPVYVATRMTPTPPPPEYYAALLRFSALDPGIMFVGDSDPIWNASVSGNLSVIPDANYATGGLAQLHDYTNSVSSSTLNTMIKYPNKLSPEIINNSLIQAVSAEALQNQGRLELCYKTAANAETAPIMQPIRVRVYGKGTASPERFKVVRGVSGLRCAVEGTVSGAPCDMATYTLAEPYGTFSQTTDKTSDPAVGYGSYVQLAITADPNSSDPWIWLLPFSDSFKRYLDLINRYLYVVYNKDGESDAAGNYEAVGGLRIMTPFGDPKKAEYRCILIPLNDDLEAIAANNLTPCPFFCGRPQQTCAGPGFAERIPLETELSTDSDAYESSWRVYLERAKQAAAYADSLGEQLLEAGLEMDRRIETAEEELENLCGWPVNVASYFSFDNKSANLIVACSPELEGQPCGAGTATNTVCRNGVCVPDPFKTLEEKGASDHTAEKLNKCLTDLGAENIALGSKPMCIWDNEGTEDKEGTREVCEKVPIGDNGDYYECPFEAKIVNKNPVCDPPWGDEKGHEELKMEVAYPLNLFDESEGSGFAGQHPCALLRKLRDWGHSRTIADRIAATGFFAPHILSQYAVAVGWEATVADFSAVTLGGEPLFSTGDPWVPIGTPPGSGTWPCRGPYDGMQDPTSSPCPSREQSRSLFCSYVDEGDCNGSGEDAAIRRAEMNYRLGRAVLALRIFSGVGVGSEFKGPFDPRIVLAGGGADGPPPDIGQKWAESRTAILFDGRHAKTSPFFYYQVNGKDYKTTDGEAVCIQPAVGQSATIWHWQDSQSPNPLFVAESFACDNVHSIPLTFNRHAKEATVPDALLVAKIWFGLDGAPSSG
ncbi:MAG: hypothetical protein V2A73_12485, partial [Pseudomonadota bacterium]